MTRRIESMRMIAVVLASMGACADPDPDPTGTADATAADGGGSAADADPAGADPADAGITGGCPALLDYGAAILVSQSASGEGAPNARANLDAIGSFDRMVQLDQLNVLMYSNEGAFGDTLPAGTFELTGIETSFATCGVCVLLYAGVTPTAIDDIYMPTAGTMDITRYDPTFQATITGLELRQVEIDTNTYATTPHPSGCTSSIASVTFDVPIVNE